MNIACASGNFELPLGFKIPINLTNPFIKDQGEQSVPVTMPPSTNNMKLIGWSWRLDNASKPLSDIDVLVTDGVFNQPAVLSINQADMRNGINCTLYFNRSTFYTKLEDKGMSDLVFDDIKSPDYETLTNAQRVDYLISLIKSEYMTPADARFYVFPAVSNTDIVRKYTYLDRGESITTTEDKKLIFNSFDTDTQSYAQDGTKYIFNLFEGEKEQIYVMDNADVTIPKGYGMTIFLKAYYVLTRLFETFGYAFDPAEMKAETGVNYPVLLHNVADSVCTGRIRPADLLPSVSIKEFIAFIEMRFAGKFIINDFSKTVQFVSYDSWLNGSCKKDYSKYLADYPVMNGTDFKLMDIKFSGDSTFKERKNVSYLEASFCIPSPQIIRMVIQLNNKDKTFNLVNVGDVVNLYSTIMINDKAQEEKTDKSSTILLVGMNTGWMTMPYIITDRTNGNTTTYEFCYRGCDADIANSIDGPVSWLRAKYASYFAWRYNSNIPMDATLNLPAIELLSLDITSSYNFENQEFFFEEITYTLPLSGEQQTTILRTKRIYGS